MQLRNMCCSAHKDTAKLRGNELQGRRSKQFQDLTLTYKNHGSVY